jgi:ribonuclease-3
MDHTLLEQRLRHTFQRPALLQQALTHRSYGSVHNERLEFLGDSVLNCVVASLLFERYPDVDEGDLSRVRANLVKQQSLYEIAQRLGVSQFLRLGEGELKSGGFRRPSILGDTLEALFGATFLDAGFNAARDVIRALYIPILDTVDPKTLGKDAKTLLQEYLQGKKIALPQYNVVATHGAAHNQEFEIECLVPKLDIQVYGSGGSRRAGEQAAAKLALEAAQKALLKTPAAVRKSRPRASQLKLAGIATVQPDAPTLAVAPAADGTALAAAGKKPAASAERAGGNQLAPAAKAVPLATPARAAARPKPVSEAKAVNGNAEKKPAATSEAASSARGPAAVPAAESVDPSLSEASKKT